MANVTAADVKRLREQTGAGMMDCKKALSESDGDFDRALEWIRVKGLKGVEKRESRTASNGLIAISVQEGAGLSVGVMVEVNCETDFVAKGERFGQVAQQVLDQAVASGAQDVPSLLAGRVPSGGTVQELIDDANASIGEKVEIRRLARLEAPHVTSYLHRTSPDLPPQVGVLVATDAQAPVARDVAMHVAAMKPRFLDRDAVPADVVEHERRIAEETARQEGKPEQALARIVEGHVGGFFKENVLLEQAFAKESKKTVAAVLAEAGVAVTGFARFRVGA
ncbi:MAG: translation elongation factor Ts [Chloroflexota bacterium]|nr:translation elongation factor Ts [Chloroflexota bacterium]